MKKRRGAAVVEVRREVGEVGEAAEEEEEVEPERREVVGSRWLWR